MNSSLIQSSNFKSKVEISFTAGRFHVRTLATEAELRDAFQLRFQIFQIEMAGKAQASGFDEDQFDLSADHLGVFDQKTGKLIATARFLCSKFTSKFYSEQEFNCGALLSSAKVLLEVGRVCVDLNFRKGIIVMLLWRGIAEYVKKSKAEILFGCGSVPTTEPAQAVLLYRYLMEEAKVRVVPGVTPTQKYLSHEFEFLMDLSRNALLTDTDKSTAKALLPPLCDAYFNIGCFVPGPPALDREFRCFDFLTVLDLNKLDDRLRQKLLGES